jgi:hypothetical protein
MTSNSAGLWFVFISIMISLGYPIVLLPPSRCESKRLAVYGESILTTS